MKRAHDRISSIHDPRYRRIIAILVRGRENAGLTQSALAEVLGLTQPDVSKIERCERRLDLLEGLDWISATATPEVLIPEILEALRGVR